MKVGWRNRAGDAAELPIAPVRQRQGGAGVEFQAKKYPHQFAGFFFIRGAKPSLVVCDFSVVWAWDLPRFFWLRCRVLLFGVADLLRFFLLPAALPEDFSFFGPLYRAFRPGRARRSKLRLR
jgi:hypothetical protein